MWKSHAPSEPLEPPTTQQPPPELGPRLEDADMLSHWVKTMPRTRTPSPTRFSQKRQRTSRDPNPSAAAAPFLSSSPPGLPDPHPPAPTYPSTPPVPEGGNAQVGPGGLLTPWRSRLPHRSPQSDTAADTSPPSPQTPTRSSGPAFSSPDFAPYPTLPGSWSPTPHHPPPPFPASCPGPEPPTPPKSQPQSRPLPSSPPTSPTPTRAALPRRSNDDIETEIATLLAAHPVDSPTKHALHDALDRHAARTRAVMASRDRLRELIRARDDRIKTLEEERARLRNGIEELLEQMK